MVKDIKKSQKAEINIEKLMEKWDDGLLRQD
jgi:hypothetical protein